MPNEFRVLRNVGRGEVKGMFWQTLRVIRYESGLEIQGMFWQTLGVIRYEYGLEIQRMPNEFGVLRNVRWSQIEGMLGERVMVLAQDGRRGGGQRQHAAL